MLDPRIVFAGYLFYKVTVGVCIYMSGLRDGMYGKKYLIVIISDSLNSLGNRIHRKDTHDLAVLKLFSNDENQNPFSPLGLHHEF